MVRYSVTLSPPLEDLDSWVVECNCSICARNGYLNVYVQNDCIEFETVGLESELIEVRYSCLLSSPPCTPSCDCAFGFETNANCGH